MTVSVPVAIALVLWIVGNAIAVYRSLSTNSLPDATFLVVDAAASLYVLSAAGVH